MKPLFLLLLSAIVIFPASTPAKADPYDDKARAAAQRQQALNAAQDYQKSLALIDENNSWMVKRIPRNGSNIRCLDRDASLYGPRPNGCRLNEMDWNGIPVKVCGDAAIWRRGEYTLPPEIVKCRYTLPDGRDCEMVRNTSIKPTCY